MKDACNLIIVYPIRPPCSKIVELTWRTSKGWYRELAETLTYLLYAYSAIMDCREDWVRIYPCSAKGMISVWLTSKSHIVVYKNKGSLPGSKIISLILYGIGEHVRGGTGGPDNNSTWQNAMDLLVFHHDYDWCVIGEHARVELVDQINNNSTWKNAMDLLVFHHDYDWCVIGEHARVELVDQINNNSTWKNAMDLLVFHHDYDWCVIGEHVRVELVDQTITAPGRMLWIC